MARIRPSFPSKRSFKLAVQDGMTIFFVPTTEEYIPDNGSFTVQEESWSAEITLVDGEIVEVK